MNGFRNRRTVLFTVVTLMLASLVVASRWFGILNGTNEVVVEIQNHGPETVLVVSIMDGQGGRVEVKDIAASTSVELRAALLTGERWTAEIECDSGRVSSGLGTVSGQRVTDVSIEIRDCDIAHVHYK